MVQLVETALNGVVIGTAYGLMAIGYSLVFRVLNVINFAHGATMAMGTYGGLVVLGAAATMAGSVPNVVLFLVLLLVLATVSGLTSTVLELLVFRPVRRRGGGPAAAIIAALGASIVLQEILAAWKGRDLHAYPRIVPNQTIMTVLGVDIRLKQVVVVLVGLMVVLALDRMIDKSRTGKTMRATAEDMNAASLMGISVNRVVITTFAIAGLVAGVAGLLLMILYENTNYAIGFTIGIKSLTAALLGGIGSIRGSVLGGIILGLLENFGGLSFGSQWQDAVAFVILLVILLVKPSGVLGNGAAVVKV